MSQYEYDMGLFGRRITTDSEDAQIWFNRGLTWLYAFNLHEGATCFRHAIRNDETCAMAHWGLAYALGPHYNRMWSAFGNDLESAARETYKAARSALSLTANTTPVEKALISALQLRFHSDKPSSDDEYAKQGVKYAEALGKVYHDFDHDLDVAALYAEALMSLTPWKLWNLETGRPNPGTQTLLARGVLERTFDDGDAFGHPGLLHLYIHLMEMSPTPELGLKAANHLRNLIPGAAHLLHMPSHLDILVGDYAAAILANQRAVDADEIFLRLNGPNNFYSVYRLHDHNSLIFAAMFAGQKATSLDTVDRMEKSLPRDVLATTADYSEAYFSVRWHVMVRFGMWEEIIQLALPADPDLMCVTTTTAHYAKGVAWAAMMNMENAERERQLFHEALKIVPDSRLMFPNKCTDILPVATAMLDGEIEYRRGNFDEAFDHLRLAVKRDDGISYSEPWGWMQPTRHALAALLLDQGHLEEALSVYSADLGFDGSCFRARHHPKNVWALHGYHECLIRLGRREEARKMEPLLKQALSGTDVAITASCFCRLHTSHANGRGKACCA